MATSAPILATRSLGLDIGGARIVADVSLDVSAGEFVGIIGPNGAGKTTLFNLLSGLLRPTAGTVELRGRDITGSPPYRRTRAGLGRTFQVSSVFPLLSVHENVRLAAEAELGGSLRIWRRAASVREALERAELALQRVGLHARMLWPAGLLSHGDKRKLELAMLLAGKPDVILLDEPMAGVSAEDVDELVELIRAVHLEEGKTVLMVEHRMEVVIGLAQKIAVMHHGALLAFDEPAAVMANETVQTAYLGEPSVSVPEPLIRVDDLHVHLGESHVLQGISFDVPEGGVTALLGRNGVGKTTTLRAMMGLVPRRGAVTLSGEELTRLRTHEIVRRGIGYVPEDRDVFAGLTVDENLRLAERNGNARYELVYELFPELRTRGSQKAGTLSGGQQQMVAIARALLNENPVLLVDEPTKGLAPLLVTEVAAALERAAELATVLLVEQNLAVVARVARQVVVLDVGRVVHTGPAAELLGDPERIRELLGVHGGSH